MRLYPTSSNAADVYAALEGIARIPIGRNDYSDEDRRRDFWRVFMGDEAGRRVFAVIIAMCNKPTSERDAQDGMTLSFRAGMRHVADLITMHMSEITKEPKVERQDSNNG